MFVKINPCLAFLFPSHSWLNVWRIAVYECAWITRFSEICRRVCVLYPKKVLSAFFASHYFPTGIWRKLIFLGPDKLFASMFRIWCDVCIVYTQRSFTLFIAVSVMCFVFMCVRAFTASAVAADFFFGFVRVLFFFIIYLSTSLHSFVFVEIWVVTFNIISNKSKIHPPSFIIETLSCVGSATPMTHCFRQNKQL